MRTFNLRYRILISVFIIVCSMVLNSSIVRAQYNITKFNTSSPEFSGTIIQDNNGEFAMVIYISEPQNPRPFNPLMFKLNNDGDTLFSKRLYKEDTAFVIRNFIQSSNSPVEYLLVGNGKPMDSTKYFNYFAKTDSAFNIIWEKYYFLQPWEEDGTYSEDPYILHKKNGGYVYATMYDHYNYHLSFFDLSENGDSLRYRYYDNGGQYDSAGRFLTDLLYNFDSTSYLALVKDTHPIQFNGTYQCLTIDTNLNQTKVDYYPRWFDKGLISKLLPSGKLITGGNYNAWQGNDNAVDQMSVCKTDSGFNIESQTYFADPEYSIRKDPGNKCMDFYYPNCIYTAGTFDFDIGMYVTHPSWVVIAKMDSSLNLLSEKYIGGDAYYNFNTITATSDGGALVAAFRYDHLVQDQEMDTYLFRFDSLDLTVDVPYYERRLFNNAIVYPNPGNENFKIRTTSYDSDFMLYDEYGRLILTTEISNLTTEINTYKLNTGVYFWKLVKGNVLVDRGKWVKN